MSRDASSRDRAPVPDAIAALSGGIIVSCQASEDNPLFGPESMARMAMAAEKGGAVGLRVNGPEDTRAVIAASSLPVLAIYKVDYPDSDVRITPTVADTLAVVETGAPFIALDGTNRPRPNAERLVDSVRAIHEHGAFAFADLATRDDLAGAIEAGVDAVGTTLSGYTAESTTDSTEPDLDLLTWLVTYSPVPVFAEGRYWTPDQVSAALEIGASFVVVGTAITNPMKITERFVKASRAEISR